MKKFILIFSIILTLSICQASELAISKALMVGGSRNQARASLLHIRLNPQTSDRPIELWFDGTRLRARGTKVPSYLSIETPQKRFHPDASALGNSLRLVDSLYDRGGQIGERNVNPIFRGNMFSLRGTTLKFNQFLLFGARPGSPSLIRGVRIERNSDCDPVIHGAINFAHPWLDSLNPVDYSDSFLLRGGNLVLIVDVSQAK
jgi:hypothetical protein